jgi:hypothetical protein
MARKSLPRSPAGRLLTAVTVAVSLVLIGIAQRDLQQRPEGEVRGDKRLWRLVSLNGLGAFAYLRWGRRTQSFPG